MNWLLSGNSQRRLQALVVYGEVTDFLMSGKFASMVDGGQSIQAELSTLLKVSPAILRTMIGQRCLDTVLLADEKMGEKPGFSLAEVVAMLREWEVPETSWPRNHAEWNALTRVKWTHPVKNRRGSYILLSPHYEAAMSAGNLSSGERRDVYRFLNENIIDSSRETLSCARISACIAGNRSASNIENRLHRMHDRLPLFNSLRQHLSGDSVSWEPACEPWHDNDTGLMITPISGSIELAEEGARMHHCVGGYNEECMSGSSLIFSVRLLGDRIATLELIDSNPRQKMPDTPERVIIQRASRLHMGQLYEVSNRYAQSTVRAACRRFHEAVLKGGHPLVLGPARMHESTVRKGASPAEISAAMFPDVAKILMPEWRASTWQEWIRAMRMKS